MEISDLITTYYSIQQAILGRDIYALLTLIQENPLLRGIVGCAIAIAIVMTFVIIGIWMERKVLADFQNRYGPCRVGPYGILQLIADMIKLITKEDIIPAKADFYGYWLGPIMMMGVPIVAFAAIPAARELIVADLDIGILYIEAVSSVAVIGAFLTGWAPRNKFGLIAALRGMAQMISYEIPLALSIIAVVIMAGSMSTVSIVEAQSKTWFIIPQFIGFLIFYTSFLAEAGRIPFDLREAEQELCCGWGVEYTGMRFGLGMVGEYAHLTLGSMLVVILFFGGWQGPVIIHPTLSGAIWFFLKTIIVIWATMWVRAALPRYRIDQLLNIGWKILLPLGLANLAYTSILVYIMGV
ncbi:MAG: NADH-quinone oxidoreductase subunit NuoH [Methanocellales archaeon]